MPCWQNCKMKCCGRLLFPRSIVRIWSCMPTGGLQNSVEFIASIIAPTPCTKNKCVHISSFDATFCKHEICVQSCRGCSVACAGFYCKIFWPKFSMCNPNLRNVRRNHSIIISRHTSSGSFHFLFHCSKCHDQSKVGLPWETGNKSNETLYDGPSGWWATYLANLI